MFGHNGSGKTTLLRIVLGLSRPSSGRLLLEGSTPSGARWRDFRRRLGFMPERIAFYDDLSGDETLRYFAKLRGVDPDAATPLLDRVGLAGAAKRKVSGYSKGMRQRLNLAQALVADPEILVLDEPLEGLDPRGVRDLFELLRAGSATTVVLASHRLPEVCSQVERVCILRNGVLRATGTVDELFDRLELPTRIHVYPQEPLNGTLAVALERLGASSLEERPDRMIAEVPHSRKTAFLLGLQGCGVAIRHLRVEEPSLEELTCDGG